MRYDDAILIFNPDAESDVSKEESDVSKEESDVTIMNPKMKCVFNVFDSFNINIIQHLIPKMCVN